MDSAEWSRSHVPRTSACPASRCYSLLVQRSQVNMPWKPGSLGFSAESSAPAQGKCCVDRAVSHGFDVAMSGGSCGKDTALSHLARSQPEVGTQYAHVGYPGVELVSRATYISKKKRTSRRSSATPKRSKKLNGMRNANSLHNLRSAMKPLSIFLGTIHVSHHLALLHGRDNVFFSAQCGAVNAGGAFEAAEVSMRRIWRIPSEGETQA